jgi:hypothetical protein
MCIWRNVKLMVYLVKDGRHDKKASYKHLEQRTNKIDLHISTRKYF